jgi:hypothetical protein
MSGVDTDNPELSAVRSEAATKHFNFKGGLAPLNYYFTLSPRERQHVLATLAAGARYLPTIIDCSIARRRGAAAKLGIEDNYENLADIYAQVRRSAPARELSSDPQFIARYDQVTNELKRGFYGMTRTLAREQITLGVQKLLEIETKPLVASSSARQR